jgi:hypothetical protein
VDYAYGDKNISYSQIYSITKSVKDEKITAMMKRTPEVEVAVAAAV